MWRALIAAVCVVLAGCTTAPPDGQLDCSTADSWIGVADFGQDAVGAETPQDAINDALAPYRDRHGGEIVLITDTQGSLVVEGQEVVIADATQTGGWLVQTTTGCAEYTT